MHSARFGFALLGSTTLAAAALWTLGACSANGASPTSESNPTQPAAGNASGSTSSSSSSGSPTDPGTGAADAGSDCGKTPTLHPSKGDAGVYCPFSATAGGKNVWCGAGEQCCETPTGTSPSTCVPHGSACPVAKSTAWECESAVDCGGTKKCCAHASDGGAVSVGNDTCGPYLSKFGGTRCAASCAAGELVVCEQASDCTSGTCTAVKPKGNDMGVCN